MAFAPLTVRASLAVPAAVTPSEPESPGQPTQPPVKPAEPSEPAPMLGTLSGTVPKVSGKAQVKSKLTATVGAWSPSGVSLRYEWTRGGTVIPGATGAVYKVQPSEGGAKLSFRVTGTKAGYTTLVNESAPTKMVPWSKLETATPKIKGRALLGATLTASPGRWTSGAQFSYQWLRAGKVVAAGAIYTLTTADVGKAIKVKVTGTKQGYKTVAKTSKGTKKVR